MPIKCRCGQENPDSALNCENCGERLGAQSVNNPYQSVPYGQPKQTYYQAVNVQQGEQPVSIGAWIGLLILFSIPVVNIISYIVILCASQNKTLKNFIIAQFIMIAVVVVLSVLMFAVLGVSFAEFAQQYAIITA